jgi:hypothetical protein
MRRHWLPGLIGCSLLLAVPAMAEPTPAPAPAGPDLEIPDVVVEGSDPTVTAIPSVNPSEPQLESQFNPPPAGPSATERELRNLTFRTEPNLFAPKPLSYRDGRTVLSGSFGQPEWFQVGGWDSRQIGPFHSFIQADYGVGTGIVAPWQKGLGRLALGWDYGDWRINFAGDGDYLARKGDTATAGQMWGNGRLSFVHPVGADRFLYRLGWESGFVQGSTKESITVQQTVTPIGDGPSQTPITLQVGQQDFHGGDAGMRWEPSWGSHRPLLDVGGGFHWSGITPWPVGSVLAADRFQWGASDWEFGLKYDMVGQDHAVAPQARMAWRGWPETLITAAIDGGQQTPFAGSILRQRPFAQFGTDLRSEYMLANAHLRLERRLTRGLVLGLGADAGVVDRKLYWGRMGESPFWQLRNAPGPMLLWGGDAGVRYDLGGVIPFARYTFQQASTPEAKYPTDGRHDLRLGFEMGFERFRLETALKLLSWNLSPLASGRELGAQPNALLVDGALAYDITDTVHAHLRVSDGLLRSTDMLPGYWEPAFAVMGGLGLQF